MAIYDLSVNGVQQLNSLARNLLITANNILDASQRLSVSVQRLSQGLGFFSDDIMENIKIVRQSLGNCRADVILLAEKIRKKSELIAQVIEGTFDSDNSSNNFNTEYNFSRIENIILCCNEPRSLKQTFFGYVQDDDGNFIYDSPIETGNYLYDTQGTADPDYQGTCGLCSCVNILRLAGVLLTESDILDYARSKTLGKLCSTGYRDPDFNGNTCASDRKKILSHFGINSSIVRLKQNGDEIDQSNLQTIADAVSEGRGVILSVHEYMLVYNICCPSDKNDDLHAVVVTSVKKDDAGRILGFYIFDSSELGTVYYPAEKLRNSLSGLPMNITDQILR